MYPSQSPSHSHQQQHSPNPMLNLLSPNSSHPASSLHSPSPNNDLSVLQHILSTSPPPFSEMSILKIDTLPSHLHSLRRLALQDDSALHLQVSPPASVPLLRHERTELETEAATLRLLGSAGLPVPRVIRHEADPTLLGAEFLLTTSLTGIPLGQVLPSATRAWRRSIDAQIDELEERLVELRSQRFGPVGAVARGDGWDSWGEAFDAMLVSVLKDGEDMFVNLPYAQIRQTVALGVCRQALSEITVPKLVVGGLGGPDGVLVEVSPPGEEHMDGDVAAKVCGLVGCKVAWWGDRAMEIGAEIWARNDDGDGAGVGVGEVEMEVDGRTGGEGWEVVKKAGEGREVRMLLYAVYHSTVNIVTGFYRPGREHMVFPARRKLTRAISQLNHLAAQTASPGTPISPQNSNSSPRQAASQRRSTASQNPATLQRRSAAPPNPPASQYRGFTINDAACAAAGRAAGDRIAGMGSWTRGVVPRNDLLFGGQGIDGTQGGGDGSNELD